MNTTQILADLEAAANAESPPLSPLTLPVSGRKRPRTNSNTSNSSHENTEEEPTPSTSVDNSPDKNILAYVQKVARARNFRKELHDELRAFAADTPVGRQITIYAELLEIRETVKTFRNTKPPFTVPSDLKKNIVSRSLGVLLSSHLGMYKGNVPADHVMSNRPTRVRTLKNILKRKELDSLPKNIDKDTAIRSTVVSCIKDALSEHRTRIKIAIRDSIKSSDAAQHQNIYSLTAKLCKKTKHCVPSVPLCARVALMRLQYEADAGDSFWDNLDKLLADMRRIAGRDPKKLTKMFLHRLEQDRRAHGNVPEDTSIDADVQQWQQDIDDVISGAAAVA